MKKSSPDFAANPEGNRDAGGDGEHPPTPTSGREGREISQHGQINSGEVGGGRWGGSLRPDSGGAGSGLLPGLGRQKEEA